MAPAARVAAFLALTLLLGAQAPDQQVVIRTLAYTPPSIVLHAETNLVESDLTVRDDNGHAVAGLKASDFEVLDNGAPQTIAAFSELRTDAKPDSRPSEPKFVTFFFDDIHMGMPGPGSRVDMPFVKQAAHAFATKHLKPGDRMSIATTSGTGGLDFTGDAQRFAAAVDRLTLHAHIIQSVAEYEADSVSTLAALTAEAKRLSGMPGERILVFISAGFIMHIAVGVVYDVQSVVDRFIQDAIRWDVTVPVIDSKGLDSTQNKMPASRRPLREISEGTGGHLFENTNDLAGSMELAVSPEVTYLLAFNPGIRDGKFHTLKIRFKSKRPDSLEFRPGYLSRKDDDSGKTPTAPRGPLDEAVFSKDTLRDLSANVTVAPGQPEDGAIPVNVSITLDGAGLQFVTSHGRHTQQIVFLSALLDTNGGFVTGQESVMELALTDERLASLRKGFKIVGTLTAPAGRYQLRTVVRESTTGRLAASTAPVELRVE